VVDLTLYVVSEKQFEHAIISRGTTIEAARGGCPRNQGAEDDPEGPIYRDQRLVALRRLSNADWAHSATASPGTFYKHFAVHSIEAINHQNHPPCSLGDQLPDLLFARPILTDGANWLKNPHDANRRNGYPRRSNRSAHNRRLFAHP